MDVGIHVPIFDIDGGTTAIAGALARVGTAVEASGANWLSFMDHFFQIEPTGLPAESNMLEGYTTLGYLAADTSTVSLGLLVTGVTYRHPGILAKTLRLVASTATPATSSQFTTRCRAQAQRPAAPLRRRRPRLRHDPKNRVCEQSQAHPGNARRLRRPNGRLREARRADRDHQPTSGSPAAWIDGMAPAFQQLADLG